MAEGQGLKQGLADAKESLATIENVDGRAGADTFRLWENYKEQALLWRIIAIAQLPIALTAIIFGLVVYLTSDIVIEPPETPQPGMYSVKQLPDSEFLKVATDVINLIATYHPYTAEKQFRKAREFLWEPALSEFEQAFIKKRVKEIDEGSRSQAFMINHDLVQVRRYPTLDMVIVRIPGTRLSLLGRKPLDDEIAFYLKMTTIPKSAYNPSGIIIFDVRIKKQTAEDLRRLDEKAI